jgi:hypothetical protein
MKLTFFFLSNFVLILLTVACQFQTDQSHDSPSIVVSASNLIGTSNPSNHANTIEFYNNDVVILGQNMQCMAFKYGPNTLVTFAGCVYDASRETFSFQALPNEAGLVMYFNNPDDFENSANSRPVKFVSRIKNIVVHPTYIAMNKELRRLRKNPVLANYESPPIAFIFLENDIPLITSNKPVPYGDYAISVLNTPLYISGTQCTTTDAKSLKPHYVRTKLSGNHHYQNNFLIDGATNQTFRNLMVTLGHKYSNTLQGDGCFSPEVCPVSLCLEDLGGAVYSHDGVAGINIGIGITTQRNSIPNSTFLNIHYSFGNYEVQQWMENTHLANAQRFGFPIW